MKKNTQKSKTVQGKGIYVMDVKNRSLRGSTTKEKVQNAVRDFFKPEKPLPKVPHLVK